MFKCDIDNSFIIAAGVDDRLKDRDLVKLVCFSQMGGSLEFWVWCSVRAPTVHKTPPAPGPARPPPSSLDDVHTTQNTAKAPEPIDRHHEHTIHRVPSRSDSRPPILVGAAHGSGTIVGPARDGRSGSSSGRRPSVQHIRILRRNVAQSEVETG